MRESRRQGNPKTPFKRPQPSSKGFVSAELGEDMAFKGGGLNAF